jgi:signal transduction histidine kinase
MTSLVEAFPLAATIEALLRWQLHPDHGTENVREAFTRVMAMSKVDGALLDLDAPPLPPLVLTYGSLAGRTTDQVAATPAVSQQPIHADASRREVGSLWLDAEKESGALAARLLELAIESAWARAEQHLIRARLEALDDASRAIAGELDVERVLQLIVDRVRDLIGARYAALGTVDEQGQITRFITSGITHEQRLRIGPIPRGRGLLGLIIREGRSYRIREIRDHPDRSGFPPEHPAMHSFLGVPVVVKGRSVGNLYLTEKLGAPEFSEQDQRLAENFALHAGIAIENARLHEQVQRLAIVDERQRIGKDLHDGIIQSLYAVSLSLEDVPDLMSAEPVEAAARVERAIEALNGSIRDIRNFIFGLRPELVEQGGLVAGLATLVNEFRLNTLIDAEFEADELPDREPDAQVRAELLQIAREALSNVARHARASSAGIRLSGSPGALQLSVRDNGRGFDPAARMADGHLGLANMAARAGDLGGRLEVVSEPGGGTDIIVRVPLAAPVTIASASEGETM